MQLFKLENASFSKVASFFMPTMPNYPVVMAVIETNNPGDIWVDDLNNPSIGLVISQAGYSFIGKHGVLPLVHLEVCITVLKQYPLIKLICNFEAPSYHELFEKNGFVLTERLSFSHPALAKGDVSVIDAICHTLPSDIEVKLIDASLLKRSHWLSYMTAFYGSKENFLRCGFGIVLLKNNELISEAFACYIGGGYVETGSVTSESHRGQGYATLVRAFLMRECLKRHLMPVSSCNLDNPASAKASQKLGYVSRSYQFLVFSQT